MQFLAPLVVFCTALKWQNLHSNRHRKYEVVIKDNWCNIKFTESEPVNADVVLFQIMG